MFTYEEGEVALQVQKKKASEWKPFKFPLRSSNFYSKLVERKRFLTQLNVHYECKGMGNAKVSKCDGITVFCFIAKVKCDRILQVRHF